MVKVRSPQNLGAAVVLVALGAFGLIFSSDLDKGTAASMGPGYFPMVLSWGLVGFGAIAAFRSVVTQGPAVEQPGLRPLVFVLAAILLFGALVESLGMAIAGIVVILVAAGAQRRTRVGETIALAVGVSAFAIAVFVYALGLPLPVWWN